MPDARREAVLRGHRDEEAVRERLRELGWGVVPFGQRMWDPTTCPEYGDETVIRQIRRYRTGLDHGPDWLAAPPWDGPPIFVEVINANGWERRALELAKLSALDRWMPLAPILMVDADRMTAWEHHYQWADDCLTPATRETRNGSGKPYALFSRRDEVAMDLLFRGPHAQ